MGIIVVGLDGSDASRAALAWTLAEARLRGSTVRAVHDNGGVPLVIDLTKPESVESTPAWRVVALARAAKLWSGCARHR